MVPDETSDLPTTLPEASFLNPNRKVPSEARSLRGLFPVPVFAEFPSYSLSKNADGFLQNPFWLSYCNLRKLKQYNSSLGDIGTETADPVPEIVSYAFQNGFVDTKLSGLRERFLEKSPISAQL